MVQGEDQYTWMMFNAPALKRISINVATDILAMLVLIAELTMKMLQLFVPQVCSYKKLKEKI